MAEQSLQTLNRQRKEQEWAGRIKACRESGLGVQAWCAEQGLSYHTYYKWQQRLYRRYAEGETGFYEVSGGGNVGHPSVTVHIGTYIADVYDGADEQTIRAVLKAMKTC